MSRPPERLRRAADFQQTLRRGRRLRHPLLHLAARRTDESTARIGFSVSKRVGGAVTRNKIKRRLRMIVRPLGWRSGVDAVFLVQPEAASASYQELERAVEQLTQRLNLTTTEER